MRIQGYYFLFEEGEPFFDPLVYKLSHDGMVAITKELEPARVKIAYRQGIFPWFDDPRFVMWWFTDPRMVLKPENLAVSHSLRKRMRKASSGLYGDKPVEIRFDSCTDEVIRNCALPRRQEKETWILPMVRRVYGELAKEDFVHSVEVFVDGELVGGLYGVSLGRMFYGESMFSRIPDVSKMALCVLCAICRREQIPWIDCQQQTSHLASLGASPVSGKEFAAHLDAFCPLPAPDWSNYRGKALNDLCEDFA